MYLSHRRCRCIPPGSLESGTTQTSRFNRSRTARAALAVLMAYVMAVTPVTAQNGTVTRTPVVPMELPVEVEIELAPAASLKQAPLWKELIQLLRYPYAQDCRPDVNRPGVCITTAPVTRRPSFTATPLPPLNVWPLNYNFLTAQPMRLRTSDGEVSWDQPGPLFDQNEPVPVDQFNVPTALRTPIGHLVACPNTPPLGPYQGAAVPANFCAGKPQGSLVVYNPTLPALPAPSAHPRNGTVVAVSAVQPWSPVFTPAMRLQELAGTSTM